jgi:hypothetical protein
MKSVLISLLAMLRGAVRSRVALHLEVLALRHKLQVLQWSRAATAAPGEGRPVALGVAVALMEQLAKSARHRQAGDGHRVASSRLSLVVDVEK